MTQPLDETAHALHEDREFDEAGCTADEGLVKSAAGSHALDSGRIVVISPHLDDAIMSVGATIASAVRSGASVEVLTVFGYGPVSAVPAGPWDTKSGFRTEADACQVRRDEDRKACRILGATPRWLDFGAEPYDRRGSPAQILSAVSAAVAGADCVLIPGFPLVHEDHAELTRLLLGGNLSGHIALYAEQPYLFWERKKISPLMRAAAIEDQLKGSLEWTRRRVGRVERRLKLQAVRSYRSQLYQLGLLHIGLYRMLWHESAQGGEAIAWLS
jgi:LmbE family N-acetylglucosaminyl deacetylase